MKSAKLIAKILGALGIMLILILDTRTSLRGASEGIEMCIRTVIPAIFPFLVCSGYLTGNLAGSPFSFLRPLCRLCRIPAGTEGILITGILGGYPVGAQAVVQSYQSGALPKQDALRMLGFCSNAGPSFLFGMMSVCFTGAHIPWFLWIIHMVSAITVGVLLPGGTNETVSVYKTINIQISRALERAVRIMALICGWVILFRVVIVFLNRWILYALPETVRILLIGMLELTNGCCELSLITHPELRFVLCSGFLAFGGVCVAMQTASVISDLPLKHYLAGKLMQTLFSLLLSSAVVLHTGTPVFLFLSLFAVLIGKKQKRSGNPITVGV